MANCKVKGGYSCDRQSKYDFTASTVNYLCGVYGNKVKSVIFKEFDKYNNLVEFDSKYASTTSRSDLVMFYNGKPYIIELKERWGIYTSNFYGKEDDEEGWMLNIPKKEELLGQNWAIPLYVNLYPDNVIRLWNLNKIEEYSTINKAINEKTVEESEKKLQDRYEVWNEDSIAIQRIKGQPSNGIFISTATNHS